MSAGETELNAYMRVLQVSNDTDPLMWWKEHQEELGIFFLKFTFINAIFF